MEVNVAKEVCLALAGVAHWIERGSTNQRVASSIPSQGICLGCGPGPLSQVGATWQATTH